MPTRLHGLACFDLCLMPPRLYRLVVIDLPDAPEDMFAKSCFDIHTQECKLVVVFYFGSEACAISSIETDKYVSKSFTSNGD